MEVKIDIINFIIFLALDLNFNLLYIFRVSSFKILDCKC